jgi:hypothetical protein
MQLLARIPLSPTAGDSSFFYSMGMESPDNRRKADDSYRARVRR